MKTKPMYFDCSSSSGDTPTERFDYALLGGRAQADTVIHANRHRERTRQMAKLTHKWVE